MYCRHCGNKIADDSKFCKYCGKNVEEPTNETLKLEDKLKEPQKPTTEILTKFVEKSTVDKDFLIEADKQLYGIKVIAILSIILYSIFLLYGLSNYDLYDPYYAFGIAFLNLIFFGGFIFLSSIGLFGLNRRRSYAIPVCRAILILFAFWTGLIPIGIIILAIFWSRLKNPSVKKYLNYGIEENYNNKEPINNNKTGQEEKYIKKENRESLWAIVLLIIFLIAVIVVIWINVIDKRDSAISDTSYEDNDQIYNAGDYKQIKITDITATRTNIAPNDTIKVSLKFEEYDPSIQTTWNCNDGTFSNNKNNSVNWRAPNEIGYYIINATSRLYGDSYSKNIHIRVFEEKKDEIVSKYDENKDYDSLQNNNYDYSQMNAELNFLNKVYNLLMNEYEPAFNHMNFYSEDDWIFNDPNVIAFEETFLVKLKGLSSKLSTFSYPSNYTNDRNNLVNISNKIVFYEEKSIQYSKENNYNEYLNFHNKFNQAYHNLHNYYNNMSNIFNSKYGY
jgi:hypothetical protein